jgi:type I restriction enzyme S subunit
MARAKKEAALTPEERLQAALVPDWEWPHKLPENWCWVYAPHIFDIEYGKSLPTKQLSDTGYPVFGANGQIGFYSEYMYKQPQALMSCRGAYSGTMNKSLPYSYVTSNSLIISSPRGLMGTDCIYYLFSALNVSELISGTAQPQVTVQAFDGFPIPLSPLAEQQRIVERIESLFAKLDEAKEKAQAVVDSFETRKAAILHKAFTGELTAKWREEHGVRMESWEKKSVGELCISLKYGTAKKSDASGNVVVLRMGNLQQGEIDWSDLAYSNDPDDIEKYKLFSGDVLFNRTNSAALVGKTAIYRGEHPAIYAGYLIKLDYDHDKIIGDYFNYALNTLDAKKYCNSVKTDGVNQSNINAKKIGAYSFNVPSIPEQEKIVSVIQKLLSKEQQAKEAAEAVLDQIDLMKKSILARAFRGELGTNDPSEESAVELLKQII